MLLANTRNTPIDPSQSKICERVAGRNTLRRFVAPRSQPRQQTSGLWPKTEHLKDAENATGLDTGEAPGYVHLEDYRLVSVHRCVVDRRAFRNSTLRTRQ